MVKEKDLKFYEQKNRKKPMHQIENLPIIYVY
ncbi:hypothetical protein BX_A0181 (plasmid) [Bacillus anthracis str. A2012]|uniref:Uncharacterized protein n=1 Tax=Bacillus anthracis TaxID=1392 RepID=Q6EZK4_BACAN|nr:hypothetical protein BX_A0181 [Bacillus anthracis str. A2012]AAT35473.1 hypothetical protein GBAA_pXO1_0181 [Bacillus anthracis str. 'Ames Ancestor']ADK08202.1 hypothetical protein BACI_pCIXO101670 [Bacillus cereus biovar anthracis str. CI]